FVEVLSGSLRYPQQALTRVRSVIRRILRRLLMQSRSKSGRNARALSGNRVLPRWADSTWSILSQAIIKSITGHRSQNEEQADIIDDYPSDRLAVPVLGPGAWFLESCRDVDGPQIASRY